MISLPSIFESPSSFEGPTTLSEEDSALAPVAAVELPPPLLADVADSPPWVVFGCW